MCRGLQVVRLHAITVNQAQQVGYLLEDLTIAAQQGSCTDHVLHG
jgi:hypothetical protein